MRICIIPVCFNAYDDALRLLASINNAYSLVTGISLKVILSDNSTSVPFHSFDSSEYSFEFNHLKNNNIGYFPAFSKALETASCFPEYFDFVIVCNVDLVIASDFFRSLVSYVVGPETGVLAPGVFSERDGRDLNPKIMRRPSLLKIQFMRFVCSTTMIFKGYRSLVRIRELMRASFKKPKGNNKHAEQGSNRIYMYGAHGSFLIFTKTYFMKGAHVNYPRFLFGEEGFVAEQLRMNNLVIEHIPEIKVFDKEHSSTSKVNLNFIRSEHKKSYDYFYWNFLKSEI